MENEEHKEELKQTNTDEKTSESKQNENKEEKVENEASTVVPVFKVPTVPTLKQINTDEITSECKQNEKEEKVENKAPVFKVPTMPAPRFVKPLSKNKQEKMDGKDEFKRCDLANVTNSTQADVGKENSKGPADTQENTDKQNEKLIDENEEVVDKINKFPYVEPLWGGVPNNDKEYKLTVLKDGSIKDNISLSGKSTFTFGRLDECDVVIEHPSCSRYHALLQYCVKEKDKRKIGFYLYDMGSTHGTYVNKDKVKAKVYNRVRVGYQIRFGGSSRLYIIEVSS